MSLPCLQHCPKEMQTFSMGPRRPSVCKHAEQRVQHGAIPGLGSSSVLDYQLQRVIRKLVLLLHRSFTNISDS